MTEYFKFTTKDNCILLNDEIWAICEDKQDSRRIVTALRDMIRGGKRLAKENEELRQELRQLKKNNNGIEIARRLETIEAWEERFEKEELE